MLRVLQQSEDVQEGTRRSRKKTRTRLRRPLGERNAVLEMVARARCARRRCAPWSTRQGTYPDHPIRMVLPFSAGGGTDAVGRIVAKAIVGSAEAAGHRRQPRGRRRTIGTDIVAKAPPDGYTLLFASASHSFAPIGLSRSCRTRRTTSRDRHRQHHAAHGDGQSVGRAVADLKSFIALLKANPGKYNYASSGQGTTLHIGAEHFITTAGVNVVHVPLQGRGAGDDRSPGGQVAFMVGQASTAVPYVKNGKLVGLGVTTPKRIGSIPEVPTVAEAACPDSRRTAGT
jgi:tripartite-type tricarboxylate transporter receptor subunit TctC